MTSAPTDSSPAKPRRVRAWLIPLVVAGVAVALGALIWSVSTPTRTLILFGMGSAQLVAVLALVALIGLSVALIVALYRVHDRRPGLVFVCSVLGGIAIVTGLVLAPLAIAFTGLKTYTVLSIPGSAHTWAIEETSLLRSDYSLFEQRGLFYERVTEGSSIVPGDPPGNMFSSGRFRVEAVDGGYVLRFPLVSDGPYTGEYRLPG